MSTAAAASRLSCARALTPSRVALDASSPPPNRGVLAPARRRGRALLAGSPTRALASTPRWNVSSTAISKMSSSRTIVNDHYSFGPLDIPRSQVFAETPLSYGIVNLKPVVPGHVLVVTRRIIKRFESLTEDELVDVWTLAKKVGSALEKHHGATSLTYAIQDGPSAGQTIPHVHIHVLPRTRRRFRKQRRGAFYLTLVPIRPRWRGGRRSLRTSRPSSLSSHPLAFQSPVLDAFQRHLTPFNSTPPSNSTPKTTTRCTTRSTRARGRSGGAGSG